MKLLICSPIRDSHESIFVIKLDSDMLFHLKEGISQSIQLSKLGFKSNPILTIPFDDQAIALYSFGTIFKIRLKKGTEKISTSGIEHLTLDETERYEFAEKYKLPTNYTLIDDDIPLKNLNCVAVHGNILIDNGSVNFDIADTITPISETIPYELLKDLL